MGEYAKQSALSHTWEDPLHVPDPVDDPTPRLDDTLEHTGSLVVTTLCLTGWWAGHHGQTAEELLQGQLLEHSQLTDNDFNSLHCIVLFITITAATCSSPLGRLPATDAAAGLHRPVAVQCTHSTTVLYTCRQNRFTVGIREAVLKLWAQLIEQAVLPPI